MNYVLEAEDLTFNVSMTQAQADELWAWVREASYMLFAHLSVTHKEHHYKLVDTSQDVGVLTTYDPSDDVNVEENWHGAAMLGLYPYNDVTWPQITNEQIEEFKRAFVDTNTADISVRWEGTEDELFAYILKRITED